MQPAASDSRSGHVHGLSIRLDDGTWVRLDAVIAEGRLQRAREIRRLASAAAQWIARTARTFMSMVPAHESRHKIPMAERLAARAEGAAERMRKGDDRPLAA
jgi:hypothetical protein